MTPRERPIIFSGEMVQAILDGRKTQTRRVVKVPKDVRPDILLPTTWAALDADLREQGYDDEAIPHMTGPRWAGERPLGSLIGDVGYEILRCPYGDVGDRLWVKHSADLFPVYWKPIPGWEGVYSAGTDGSIYRMDGAEPSPLKPSSPTPTGGKGYPHVSLSRNGEWNTYNVHRLVCAAFCGREPFEGAQVRHLDGDKSNNRPENLDWGTQEQNWQDRKAHGRGMGERHHGSKLTAAQVAAIRASSRSQRALAHQYGVSQSTISAVRTGDTWGEHAPAPRTAPAFQLWRSPIFMPRWASRITLTITDVRVQRLQEMTDNDVKAEGFPLSASDSNTLKCSPPPIGPRNQFVSLWQSLNGKRGHGWDVNPFCWVLTFRRVEEDTDGG